MASSRLPPDVVRSPFYTKQLSHSPAAPRYHRFVKLEHLLAAALDPALILQSCGLDPDPWQRSLLLCDDRQILLCCSRQAGKSTVVSAMALHNALFTPGTLVQGASPAQFTLSVSDANTSGATFTNSCAIQLL